MNDLKAEIMFYNDRKEDLKKKYKSYIADKEIPIDERWELFVSVPKEFYSNQNHIYDGLDFIKYSKGKYHDTFISLYSEDTDRYYEIDLTEVIECLKDIIKRGHYGYRNTDNAREVWPCFKNPNLIEDIKEKLMTDNVRYFTHDW